MHKVAGLRLKPTTFRLIDCVFTTEPVTGRWKQEALEKKKWIVICTASITTKGPSVNTMIEDEKEDENWTWASIVDLARPSLVLLGMVNFIFKKIAANLWAAEGAFGVFMAACWIGFNVLLNNHSAICFIALVLS